MEQAFYIDKETLEILTEDQIQDPDGPGEKILVFNRPEQLVEVFDKEQLKSLRAKLRGNPVNEDNKKSPKKLSEECFKQIAKAQKKVEAQKEPKPRKESKLSRLKEMLVPGQRFSLKEICDQSGYDTKNARVAMGILKNPKRTKPEEMIFWIYDRTDSCYTIYTTAEEMEAVKN